MYCYNFRSALKNLGFDYSHSHCNPNVLKTTANWLIIYSIMREWIKKSNIQDNFKFENVPSMNIDFNTDKSYLPFSKTNNLKRFPENPRNWGPLAKHKPLNNNN